MNYQEICAKIYQTEEIQKFELEFQNEFKSIWPDFKFKPIKLLNKYERWRRVAKILKASKEAKNRLEWIIYYYDKSGMNASQTARRYGISRKTFHKWLNEFDEDNLYTIYLLEDKSKAPKNVRQSEITRMEEERIIKLRKQWIRYGKIKLAIKYQQEYNEKISSWKIQKTIEKYKLYYHPAKIDRVNKKKAKTRKYGKKKKTIELIKNLPDYKKTSGYIICLDTIVIHWQGLKRYIFTAIDKYGKFAYARMYKSKSTFHSKDFLYRLNYLLDNNVPRVGHDNGTEFEKYFKSACQELKIEQYYSRARTPKDNADCERFNQTLQTEFMDLGNFTADTAEFNKNLTEWLIEYNFHRPHQSLNYKTPLEFSNVLPMYASCTKP